jgi:hypothetical protein
MILIKMFPDSETDCPNKPNGSKLGIYMPDSDKEETPVYVITIALSALHLMGNAV